MNIHHKYINIIKVDDLNIKGKIYIFNLMIRSLTKNNNIYFYEIKLPIINSIIFLKNKEKNHKRIYPSVLITGAHSSYMSPYIREICKIFKLLFKNNKHFKLMINNSAITIQ